MTRVFMSLGIFGLFCCFLLNCEKEQETSAVEEESLSEEALGIPEEPELEMVEEDALMDDLLFEEELDKDFGEFDTPLKKTAKKSGDLKSQSVSDNKKAPTPYRSKLLSDKKNHSSPVEPIPDGKFVLQLSIFKNRAHADKLQKKLNQEGYPAYISEVFNPVPELSGTFYRVRVAGFNTLREAQQYGEANFKTLGYDFWVDRKARDGQGSTFRKKKVTKAAPVKAVPKPTSKPAPKPKKIVDKPPVKKPEPQKASEKPSQYWKKRVEHQTEKVSPQKSESEKKAREKASPQKSESEKPAREKAPEENLAPAPVEEDDWGTDDFGDDIEWGEDEEW